MALDDGRLPGASCMNRARDKPVEWAPQVKAFRWMVSRSVTWTDWDEDLLSLELEEEPNAADFALSLTGFDAGEFDVLLAIPDDERANAATPIPKNPVSGSRPVVGLRKASGAVRRCNPVIELDSEWRDRAGLNGRGPAEPRYMKCRTRVNDAINRQSRFTRSMLMAFGLLL